MNNTQHCALDVVYLRTYEPWPTANSVQPIRIQPVAMTMGSKVISSLNCRFTSLSVLLSFDLIVFLCRLRAGLVSTYIHTCHIV